MYSYTTHLFILAEFYFILLHLYSIICILTLTYFCLNIYYTKRFQGKPSIMFFNLYRVT